MTKTFRIPLLALGPRCCCRLLPQARAASDDQPWVLDANNWQEGKDLLPEPVLKRLKDGRVLVQGRARRSGEVQGELLEEVLGRDARRTRASTTSTPKTCGLKDKSTGKIPDFVFGLPFPKIDKSDPQAACKIA